MSRKKDEPQEKRSAVLRSPGEKAFDIFLNILGLLIAILAAYPVYYIIISSLSRPLPVESGQVLFRIVGLTGEAYKQAFQLPNLWVAYGNTFYYAIVGVLVNMFLTTTMAFSLSRKRLVGRKLFTLMIVFTMWFHAGLIPTYMNFKSLGLLYTRSAIIIGFGISAYNLVIMKNFFESIPQELEEAATVDGASSFRVFGQIFLPMSKPALATVAMFYLVNRWNGYFWPMTLLKDDRQMPLQVMLKKMLVDQTANETEAQIITAESLWSPTTRIYAIMVIAIIPMLIVYPFIQKYFKTGVMAGAVKG